MKVLTASIAIVLGIHSWAAANDAKTSEIKLSEDEKAFLEMANNARAKCKLPPLAINELLLRAARDHAVTMAKKGEMNHVIDGMDTAKRVKAAGFDYEKVAENIAACEKGTAAKVFSGWMEAQHNKDNILSDEFKELGVGVAKNDKGETYYTLIFASARPKREPTRVAR